VFATVVSTSSKKDMMRKNSRLGARMSRQLEWSREMSDAALQSALTKGHLSARIKKEVSLVPRE